MSPAGVPVALREFRVSRGGVMKTKSASIDKPRLGRPAALALTLSASLIAQGAGLWLALAGGPGASATALSLIGG
ncbi:MAG TPA: hypothetical protein VJ738_07790, partial [Steroidobacteraceae bacterium]|nr:hypothetical protein [Steroidobacteraceae bacterium]